MMISHLRLVFAVCFLVVIISVVTAATDTISVTKSLKDNETLDSSGGSFRLGFFKPGKSNNLYVGIWYKKITPVTAVWIANRDNPLSDSSGIFQITKHSTLVILNSTKHIIWSTNSTRSTLKNPIAQLLDTGNLVIRDVGNDNPENLSWQSFDHPCHIQLPGMKIGFDLMTGLERHLTSWSSSDDPTSGNYTNRIDPRGYPEMIAMKGNSVQYRYGPWNGLRFSGFPGMEPNNTLYRYWFEINQKEIYYSYVSLNNSVITHRVLDPDGRTQRVIWDEHAQAWNCYLAPEIDNCETYATCGAFGSCNVSNSPHCVCIKGFVPKDIKAWEVGDSKDGCVRKTSLACSKQGDQFWKISNVKPPDTHLSWFNASMNLEECKEMCLMNCSCTAYSNLDVSNGGSGCLLWFRYLVDIRMLPYNGEDLFIKLASSEIGNKENEKHFSERSGSENKRRKWIILGCTLLTAVLLLCLSSIAWVRRKKQRINKGYDLPESELPILDFSAIAHATCNFSDENKIGEGGFGVVYKGTLKGGQDIAVKKLSKESSQGLDEFKNEVIFLAKLQHRNLVKLLGCSIQADERLLVYEYMPNKALDNFIFEEARIQSLDWPKRFDIINGIARGLLYLHQDSRLRIVHRDLKASNVLLDHELNPKISDFGTARCFYGSEELAVTRRVIGTYGYMSPEYAVDGIFSVKSDVFSFGVLVLEIITGMKNRGFIHKDHQLNLLGHAWRLFEEGKAMKLIDKSLNYVTEGPRILRSIHVGLLCVQQRPEDRPSMLTVVLMLSSEAEMPKPQQPGFFTERNLEGMNSISSEVESPLSNEVSTTSLAGR